MKTFQIGDVVRLKSGGPAMTVDSIGQGGVLYCKYYRPTADGFHTMDFFPDTVEKAEPVTFKIIDPNEKVVE
jgi:uncharacterized protein YodC (DUF2158 family)